jgi:hypothetical protein
MSRRMIFWGLLALLVAWTCWQRVEAGTTGVLPLITETASYMTTPGHLLMIFGLVAWYFWKKPSKS